MKKRILALTSAAAALLTGCIVTSVHPYYTSKDVDFQPVLLGQWTNTQQADERWTFEKLGQDGYHLDCVSDGKPSTLEVRLFKLHGQMFLDMAALGKDCDISPPPVPSHFLLRVFQLSPTVQLAPLNHDWLKALLEKEPKTLSHLMVGDKPDDQRVVLTGGIPELQRFVAKHLDTADAWKDRFELHRK